MCDIMDYIADEYICQEANSIDRRNLASKMGPEVNSEHRNRNKRKLDRLPVDTHVTHGFDRLFFRYAQRSKKIAYFFIVISNKQRKEKKRKFESSKQSIYRCVYTYESMNERE